MSEHTNDEAIVATAVAGPGPGRASRKATERDKASMGAFATEEEAQAHQPDNPAYAMYTVVDPVSGKGILTWNESPKHAISRVVEALGWTAYLTYGARNRVPAAALTVASDEAFRAEAVRRGLIPPPVTVSGVWHPATVPVTEGPSVLSLSEPPVPDEPSGILPLSLNDGSPKGKGKGKKK